MASASGASEGLQALAHLVNGCKDEEDGVTAKKSLVEDYLDKTSQNVLDVMCWLHLLEAVTVDGMALIQAATWYPQPALSSATMKAESSHPGLFLCSALSAVGAGGNAAISVVQQYIEANPEVDVIELLRYVNQRGYMTIHEDSLLGADSEVVSWKRPPPRQKSLPSWCKKWAGSTFPTGPVGPPVFVKVTDPRGRKSSIAFLGSADPTLKTPTEVLLGTWKLQRPAMLVSADAGSMHPRQLDSISMMCNLPQYYEWVEAANAFSTAPSARDEAGNGDVEAGAGVGENGSPSKTNWSAIRKEGGGLQLKTKVMITLRELMKISIDEWRNKSHVLDTDVVMGDGSINVLIFTKLTEVFCALLDAVTVAGSWLIVDRTDGQGSATAELLLEHALERGAAQPTIIAIDSLERLAAVRDGPFNSGLMMKQLIALYQDENATSTPNGTEKELEIDFLYKLDSFEYAGSYTDVHDSKLPFKVLPDHQRINEHNTCDPNRKWRYFYVDGLFSSATHYIIKSNDMDEFSVDTIAPMGYVYAHGDSRTFKRLRANMQQGKTIVMLHNSGSVTTAFSWLQRVFAYQRPAPDINSLKAPLKFLIAHLSKANWTHDFGVTEMIMMRGLAERAPQLFRKHVVSVDIMSNSEEEVLEVITGAFAQISAAGVPELGLGNAEANVVYSAWNLHCTLCQNAKTLNRLSKVAAAVIWILALATVAVAVLVTSINGGAMKDVDFGSANVKTELVAGLEQTVLLLPIFTALITTMVSRLVWRDKVSPWLIPPSSRMPFALIHDLVDHMLAILLINSPLLARWQWSVCLMAASQLAAEIYKFRMGTLEYDTTGMTKPPEEGQDEPAPMTPKEKATAARGVFVMRVQTMYQACLTELSQNGALKTKRPKMKSQDLHPSRTEKENKPTLAEWFKIKMHAERFFYKANWMMPTESFLNWLSGLRPYLHGKSFREELSAVVKQLANEGKVALIGRPLTDHESTLVRHEVAKAIGLKKHMLDKQKDEIRKIQRDIVSTLYKQQREMASATGGSSAMGAVAGRAASGSAQVMPLDDDDDVFADATYAMRKQLMELQGYKYGKKEAKQIAEEKKKKKRAAIVKEIEDDYLCGPLSVESYVVFRVRPICEKLEKHSHKLALRLQLMEIIGFIFNAAGTILVAVGLTEWVTLTVAVVSTLSSIIEFSQLRNQVVASNLALRDLQQALVDWDSLSVVRRRTCAVKAMLVDATEEALINVVISHTTAAAGKQVSVKRELARAAEADEEKERANDA